MNEMNIPENRQDDYYGVAAIALCEAANLYDENDLDEQESFVGFAKVIIKNQLIDEFRKENAMKRKNVLVEDINIEEVSSDLSVEIDFVDNANLMTILDILKPAPRIKEVFLLLYEGYSCKEIGEKANISQVNIRHIKNSLKKIIKEVMQ
jgi:RNA polymerase sigma factor (sigma-70 family)